MAFPPLHKQTDEELEQNRKWYSDAVQTLDKECAPKLYGLRSKALRIYKSWIEFYDKEIERRKNE